MLSFDLNGIRLELTVDENERHVSESDRAKARRKLDDWSVEKAVR